MLFEFHPESNMLYIKLADGTSVDSEEVAPGIVIDFDAQNRIIGIEIEDATDHLDLSKLELKSLPLENVTLSSSATAEM